MSPLDSMSAKPSEAGMPRRLWLLGILVMAVGSGLVALLYFGPGGNVPPTSVRADIIKSIAGAILQLTVLGVVGVAVKWEFDRYQEQRREAREDADRDRRERQEDADRAQQARNSLTELRKALLRRVLTANRMVRKARILIPAHASAKTYGEQMRILIDAGLEFSDIRHEIETIPTLFADSSLIQERFVNMERYLEGLAEEYRLEYQGIVAVEKTEGREAVRAALDTLTKYKDFAEGVPGSSGLYMEYLPSYWDVREAMRRDILGGLLG